MNGTVAIVTGGGGTIGSGVCRALANAGATVAALDLDPSGADAAALRITVDLTDAAACAAAVEQVVAELGGIDTLVNTAQRFRNRTPFVDVTEDDLDVCWTTGPLATFHMMQLAHPHLVARGGGAVINFGSGAGTAGEPGYGAYAAAKEAVRGLTKVAASEWGADNIRVNVVCPVVSGDPSAAWITDDGVAGIPLGRIGDAENDIGAAIVYLAGPHCYMTGRTLMLDGGSGKFR
jgi:NAD(P)-dependent dehydrogenase (short-subunit alcohol dehydrogenase family)